MPTPGELLFYQAIGDAGATFALNKPFSEEDCGLQLMQVGALMSLLPPPPARILECGCGTGWLCRMLAEAGYDCVGVDVAEDAISLARGMPPPTRGSVDFQVCDNEALLFNEEFDPAVFFGSLHHSIDEGRAIQNVFRALRPGGVCVTSEPGRGHAEESREVVERYGTTEKDMPAAHIIRLAKAAGFSHADTYPRMDDFGRFLFTKPPARHWWQNFVRRNWALNLLNGVRVLLKIRRRLDTALVRLHKASASAALPIPVDGRRHAA